MDVDAEAEAMENLMVLPRAAVSNFMDFGAPSLSGERTDRRERAASVEEQLIVRSTEVFSDSSPLRPS